MFLLKLEKNNERKLYGPNSFKHRRLKQFITFIHAFSGCDSTSGFHFQGKNTLIKNLNYLIQNDKLKDLINDISFFYDKDSNETKIIEVGNLMISLM